MPLMISRIGQSRGRPVAQGFGKCGAITRHSASVRSVWYRVSGRLCCCRVVGVHMANPRLVGETPWNHRGRCDSTIFKSCLLTRARGLNLDIDGWLRGIGLEQYAQTFRDNAIDADVLCDLTDEHLRELGLPLGARLKLLRAVAALSTGQTPISPEIITPAQRTAPSVAKSP